MTINPKANPELTTLNIAQHNVHSFKCNKNQIIDYLDRNNIHVCSCSEIWMKLEEELLLKNYKVHYDKRTDGYAGSALLFKNNITFTAIELPKFEIINVAAAITENLPENVTFISVYVPAKRKELPENIIRRDLIKLSSSLKSISGNYIVGGDFNAFQNSWGSSYNDMRGILLMEEFESICLLNDGSPTRMPTNNTKPNALDLTWSTSGIFDRVEWEVKKETLGSDHMVISMRIAMGMNSEKIKVKPKIDYEAFKKNIDDLDTSNVKNLSDFIMLIEGAKDNATPETEDIEKPQIHTEILLE